MLDAYGRSSKRCSRCEIVKPIEAFCANRTFGSGRDSQCKDCRLEYRKAYYSNPETKAKLKASEIKSKRKFRYGLTEDAYQSLLASQDGVCAICGQPPSGTWKTKHLHVDHDHAATNKIRGLICLKCNSALAQFGDDLEGIMRVVRYLKGGVP